MADVVVLMGSDSDYPVMKECCSILEEFGVNYIVKVISAHRSPELLRRFIRRITKEGIKIIIAGAGGAAHLPGVVASMTTLPVIGVPVYTKVFNGVDSLLSMVQMPSGVPVGCMAIGAGGAKNAGIFAVQILALNNPSLKKRLDDFKRALVKKVQDAQKRIELPDNKG